jgi:hypothetical protein
MLSEAYGKKKRKSQVFPSGINKSKRVATTWKMMKEVVITFFDIIKSTAHFEFLPQGRTVNQVY